MWRDFKRGLFLITILLAACQSQSDINLNTAKNAGLSPAALTFIQPWMARVLGDNYKLDVVKRAPHIPDVIAKSPTSSKLKELWCVKLIGDKDFVQAVIWFDGTAWAYLDIWGSEIIRDPWVAAGC